MQLTATAAIPARDRIRPLMPADIQDKVPDVVLDTRIGRGTVASELDRNVRVRFEGDGLPSERRIIPETTTAQKLLASPAGKPFEALLRRTLATADAARGADDLRSITLAPDEHAAKAATLIDAIGDFARQTGAPVRLTESGSPAAEKAAAREVALGVATHLPGQIAFAAARNRAGDMLVMPDVARGLLASVGAYQPQAGDDLVAAPPTVRRLMLREGFDTLVHEAHHSVTPQLAPRESATTGTFEESIATIFGNRLRGRVSSPVSDAVAAVVADPTSARDQAKLGWKPWNREHLPKPPTELTDTAQAHYVDGPAVVRRLLRGAGVDLRTREGHARAFDILQGRAAAHAPRRLADALVEARGIDAAHREDVVRRVRESVSHPDGARHVLELLDRLAPAGG